MDMGIMLKVDVQLTLNNVLSSVGIPLITTIYLTVHVCFNSFMYFYSIKLCHQL